MNKKPPAYEHGYGEGRLLDHNCTAGSTHERTQQDASAVCEEMGHETIPVQESHAKDMAAYE